MQAQPDPSDSLVFECDFDEPPEKVWRALTEPRLLAAWLTAEGSPGTGEGPAPAAPEQSAPGDYDVIAAEPHRLLRYRWRDRERGAGDSQDREVHSVVTVELVPCPTGGTHLRLTHGEFRIVSATPRMRSGRITSIASARRLRTRILSSGAQTPWRRAA